MTLGDLREHKFQITVTIVLNTRPYIGTRLRSNLACLFLDNFCDSVQFQKNPKGEWKARVYVTRNSSRVPTVKQATNWGMVLTAVMAFS